MKAKIQYNNKEYSIDLNSPIDISIEMSAMSARAWYQDPLKINPVVDGDFIGEVAQGAPVNFRNIAFNPHAHGTHTECFGHISKTWESVSDHINTFFHFAQVVTINPVCLENGDYVITKNCLINSIDPKLGIKAIVVRTLPNDVEKVNKNYSNTNPPYILEDAMQYIVNLGIEHFLIDLPSVDKENDEGKLLAHRVFWNYPRDIRENASITELIYVPNQVKDGTYFVNIQFPRFNNDASPSRIFLYSINE